MKMMKNNKKYYLKYHSEMTDTIIYFVSTEKEILRKYQFVCELYLDNNYQNDFDSIFELLKEKKITIFNSENNDFDEDDFDEMLKYYSFRF
jgi:hypothetical protein